MTIKAVGKSPAKLLEACLQFREQDRWQAQKAGDIGSAFDACWLVTDVDQFDPELHQVLLDAASEGVKVAVSNPCFELWLYWHVAAQGAHVTTKDIQNKALNAGVVGGRGGKEIAAHLLAERFELARGRAVSAQKRHLDVGVPVHSNPSSGVHVLVNDLSRRVRDVTGRLPVL